MDIQALKSELVKYILATDSKDILDKLWTTIKREEKDFWLELTDAQKREVEIGLKQIETARQKIGRTFLIQGNR